MHTHMNTQVNDVDATNVTHEQAIRLLTTSPDPLTLLVRHEPPPHGLNVCKGGWEGGWVWVGVGGWMFGGGGRRIIYVC